MSRKDKSLLTWGLSGKARIWDIKTGREEHRIIHALSSQDNPVNLYSTAIPSEQTSLGGEKPSLVRLIDIGRQASAVDTGAQVRTFGWGKTRPTANVEAAAVLNMAGLSAISTPVCLAKLNKKMRDNGKPPAFDENHIDSNVFCAHAPAVKACQGDSGGPVLKDGKVVGVVSWGTGGCGEAGEPSMYTRVANFADWIDKEIAKPRQ